jgi:signal peptidase I
MAFTPAPLPELTRRQQLKTHARRFWREWLRPFALLFLVVAPLRSAVVDWNWVPTGSMKPTILEGDMVLVNKLAYDLHVPFTKQRIATWANPARGDIAVCFSPTDGTRLVKRVIGLPGDVIESRNDVLYVNGVPQRYSLADVTPFRDEVTEDTSPVLAIEHLDARDHYILALPNRPAVRSFGPITVPADQYFMMGDSRDNSHDSRFFGPVARGEIVGEAKAVLVSFDRSRYLLPRLSRFGHALSRL